MEANALEYEIEAIVQSGVLGRSPIYPRLLRYLAAATSEQNVASEVDIATDVFEKGSEFASNQDSSVRVYVHNLRQRLDRYYEQNSERENRVTIPKGEYRLNILAAETQPDINTSSPHTPPRSYLRYAFVALLVSNLILIFVLYGQNNIEKRSVAESQIWAPILNSDLPLLIVVGDYFIFGEVDSYGRVSRMVREFNVNSADDLESFLEHQISDANNYLNLNLSYLPQSMAFALNDVLAVVHSRGKQATIVPSSKLRISDLKTNNVLYLGYLSGLGILESYVFAASTLEVGTTYDELLNPDSGEYFLSNAGIPDRMTYQDFALLTTFPGPGAETQILVATGTRDAGLMYIAEALASYESTKHISERMRAMRDINRYEALFRVAGSNRTSVDASLIYDTPLTENEVWAQHY